MKRESSFQADLKKDLKKRFPDSLVVKSDPLQVQGIPDLLIFCGRRWAALECKRQSRASHRPNQDYYVDKMNHMSFSRFIYPENKEDVLNELQEFFSEE
mgnify:CR=1 FL=1